VDSTQVLPAAVFPGFFRRIPRCADRHRYSGALRQSFLAAGFDGKSVVTSTDICHYVPCYLASYVFSAWVKTKAVTTDQGVRFQLRSLGAPDNSAARDAEVHGSEPWTTSKIPWSPKRRYRKCRYFGPLLSAISSRTKLREQPGWTTSAWCGSGGASSHEVLANPVSARWSCLCVGAWRGRGWAQAVLETGAGLLFLPVFNGSISTARTVFFFGPLLAPLAALSSLFWRSGFPWTAFYLHTRNRTATGSWPTCRPYFSRFKPFGSGRLAGFVCSEWVSVSWSVSSPSSST